MKDTKVHHQTERGARIALAKKQISRASYEAILLGDLSLADAKSLGRDRGTSTPALEKVQEEAPESAPCMCGCGQRPKSSKSRFVQGHDARLHGELKRNLQKDPLLRNERFSDEQRAYAVERKLIAE